MLGRTEHPLGGVKNEPSSVQHKASVSEKNPSGSDFSAPTFQFEAAAN